MDIRKDEVDLLSLLMGVIAYVKRYLGIILLLGTIGMVLGLGYAMIKVNIYQSRLLLNSDILTYSYAEKFVSNLNSMIRDRNYPLVANRLQLSETGAKQLINLSIETALENQTLLREDEKKYFLISVEVSNQAILDSLQRGLIHYFEDNEYVKVRVQQRKENYQQLIKSLDDEIVSLEEFKRKIYSGDLLEKSNGNLMFDPTQVNSKIIELKRVKVDYEDKLQLVNSVQVMEGFATFNRPINNRKLYNVFAGGVIGVILAFLILGIRSLSKFVKEQESLRS